MAVVTRRQRELLAWLAQDTQPAVFVLGASFGIGMLIRRGSTREVVREDLHDLVDQRLVDRIENRYEITSAGRGLLAWHGGAKG
jgi:hypothetical protein